MKTAMMLLFCSLFLLSGTAWADISIPVTITKSGYLGVEGDLKDYEFSLNLFTFNYSGTGYKVNASVNSTGGQPLVVTVAPNLPWPPANTPGTSQTFTIYYTFNVQSTYPIYTLGGGCSVTDAASHSNFKTAPTSIAISIVPTKTAGGATCTAIATGGSAS